MCCLNTSANLQTSCWLDLPPTQRVKMFECHFFEKMMGNSGFIAAKCKKFSLNQFKQFIHWSICNSRLSSYGTLCASYYLIRVRI